eukprot:Plantae.Rhodophyta-Purpureofilum_apyrenoidigerum.ctg21753.p1 GENE.Plantae.Rhodophyta-Purpureofilum_apyrenoidigerum.ctg21753~~Plantae.Rhodophyta-Purpureofilum_apyrenoidigerum.ctg21753.p1  ORF type:complete len:487 (+),score=95.08 Plantae.Rhodophyta-Purpureofilum_apyrenoidigerum.ctg21753:34-1461(+)
MDVEALNAVLKVLESDRPVYIERLREAVAIDSVSNDPEKYPKCLEMAEFLKENLERLSMKVRFCSETAEVKGPNDSTVPVPPIILASFETDPAKKTLCAYGHYDVMPAAMSEGWSRDPFSLTEIGDELHGRGASDDKGPVLSWIAVVEAHQRANRELPVNLKFIFEGREEAGSDGLETLVERECGPGGFFNDVEYIVISDSGSLGTRHCLTYGLRGVAEYEVVVSGPADNLHSGLYGGAVREPMHDLLKVLSSLTDVDGFISIPALQKMVRPVTEEEKQRYSSIDFDPAMWIESSSIPGVLGEESKENILMRRWRYPALSVHGIQASSAYKATCIPARCVARFSIRTVPDMHAQEVDKAVMNHLRDEFDKLHSTNSLEIMPDFGGDWFLGDVSDENYSAARRAHKRIRGEDPDLIREGGSIPITISFSKITKKSVCLLPICGGTDNIHGPNEKMLKSNLFDGMKVMAAYLYELSV